MGARNYIGYLTNDGTIRASYCQYGAPPTENGHMLLEYHNTAAKAKKLVEVGQRSVVRENPQEGRYLREDDNPAMYDGREPAQVFSRKDFINETAQENDRESSYVFSKADGGWLVAMSGRDSLLRLGKKLPKNSLGEPLEQVMLNLPVLTIYGLGDGHTENNEPEVLHEQQCDGFGNGERLGYFFIAHKAASMPADMVHTYFCFRVDGLEDGYATGEDYLESEMMTAEEAEDHLIKASR